MDKVTIVSGKTASATFKEWTGLNGTGAEMPIPTTGTPPVSPVTYVTSDASKATVDAATGEITGVAPTATTDPPVTVTGTDSVHSLSATVQVVVTAAPVPASATLTYSLNP